MHSKTFLVVSMLLLISIPVYAIDTTSDTRLYDPKRLLTEDSITVHSATCEWNIDHFDICAYVTWTSDTSTDYVKTVIAGGEDLAHTPKQLASPFSYCQNVGKDEGRRAIHSYLFDRANLNTVSDLDNTIQCKRTKLETNKFTKRMFFRIAEKHRRESSEGTFRVTGMDGTPVACKFEGEWVTDNRGAATGPTLYCDKARGIFSGYADLGIQSTTVDPSAFRWKGGTRSYIFDPLRYSEEGYFFSAYLCDMRNYDDHEHFARAYIQNFEKEGILIKWEYFNDETSPAVDVIFDLTCDVIPENAKEVVLGTAEEVPESDFFNEPEVGVEKEKEQPDESAIRIDTPKPKSFWGILNSWFRRVFLR
ncbi:MAG TPA: hypothetical protein VJC07_01135 [Candidatus Nanoarchaeia archaeon]|nr:hypothetical protein [Candidatus Nanoarchaeia archaeon]